MKQLKRPTYPEQTVCKHCGAVSSAIVCPTCKRPKPLFEKLKRLRKGEAK